MKRIAITLMIVVVAVWCGARSAGFLVREQAQKSDVIVVLAGDFGDTRYWKGMQLLRQGYGRELLVDASAAGPYWGRSPAEFAERFVQESAGDMAGRVKVCRIAEDSTVSETRYVRRCLQQVEPPPKAVLLVTSDYHTRRALSTFSNRLPDYEWSVASSTNGHSFGVQWWKRREWAKTNLGEWERLIWWEVVERWKR